MDKPGTYCENFLTTGESVSTSVNKECALQVSADTINDISAYASDQDKFSPGAPLLLIWKASVGLHMGSFFQHELSPLGPHTVT